MESGAPLVETTGQGLDVDSDGMDDAWETTYFGNLSRNGTGDFDSDGMTDLEEYTNSFNPTVDDGLNDADGDRYPNVFEVRRASNPNSSASTPTANYSVVAGGTYPTIGSAITASNVSNGTHQIIAVAAGTYSGTGNTNITVGGASKPKFLIIGTAGAVGTIIDGGGASLGWTVSITSVLDSLTFQNTTRALNVATASIEVRLVNLLVRNNAATTVAGGLNVTSAKVSLTNCTFLGNTTASGSAQQIVLTSGNTTLTNTVLYGASSGTTLYKAAAATLTTNYSLVKGMTLSGTGNLAGSTDPKLRSDGRLLHDSPLRAAGGATTQSRLDIDLETRPPTAPDIGGDQFVDSDADSLADFWETAEAGNLTTLTSLTQDLESDGLNNQNEYLRRTHPTTADSDGDGLSDGNEVNTQGTDPLKTDTDADDMPDGWEVSNSLSPLVANALDDADGDRYPNVFEYAKATNPQSTASVPTADLRVGAGQVYATVAAALTAANVSNGAYQIMSLAAGTYTGASNLAQTFGGATKPKFLVIGTSGAASTIIDGGTGLGWTATNTTVFESLTFTNTSRALYTTTAGIQVRLIDLVVKKNAGSSLAGGFQMSSATGLIANCTFLENTSATGLGQQIAVLSGALTVVDTVVYGASSSTMLYKATGASLTTNYDLVKGQTLTGTGNIAGNTDPKLRSDGRLLHDSPLRSAGGAAGQSAFDADLEARPSTTPDIGADQFRDTDADSLADIWETGETGNLTSLTGLTQDQDSDGLNNQNEYAKFTHPTNADSDGDGLSDGNEVNTHGTDPLSTDTDADDMPDGWEVNNGLNPLVVSTFDDADGDRYPNVFEYARSTNHRVPRRFQRHI